jgi:hypothetical protein
LEHEEDKDTADIGDHEHGEPDKEREVLQNAEKGEPKLV